MHVSNEWCPRMGGGAACSTSRLRLPQNASRSWRLITLPLALRGNGSCVVVAIVSGTFVVGESLGAPGAARRPAFDVDLRDHHDSMHALAQHRARLGDDRASTTAGWPASTDSTSAGIDLREPAAVDHVLLPVEHADEIVLRRSSRGRRNARSRR